MDRDMEEAPAAKRPRLGGTKAGANLETIEEHISLGKWAGQKEGIIFMTVGSEVQTCLSRELHTLSYHGRPLCL